MVDIAVEARLFGRVRLLTIDATVDIADVLDGSAAEVGPAIGELAGGSEAVGNHGDAAVRRSAVEAMLQEAAETLDAVRP